MQFPKAPWDLLPDDVRKQNKIYAQLNFDQLSQ